MVDVVFPRKCRKANVFLVVVMITAITFFTPHEQQPQQKQGLESPPEHKHIDLHTRKPKTAPTITSASPYAHVPHPALQIVCLCFPTVVDKHRHGERVETISRTWGKSVDNVVEQGSRWTTTIVLNDDVPKDYTFNDAANDDHTLSHLLPTETGTPMGPTMQRIWALRKTLANHPNANIIMMVETCTYVLVENVFSALRSHLNSRSRSATAVDTKAIDTHLPPFFFGVPLKTSKTVNYTFVSGGAGSIFSRRAIEQAVAAWDNHLDQFPNAATMPYDLGLARLFGELGLQPDPFLDTSGEARFHVFGPVREYRGNRDQWVLDYSNNLEGGGSGGGGVGGGGGGGGGGVGVGHGSLPTYLQSGLACCARDSVTFHYVEPQETEFLFMLWHTQQATRNTTNNSENNNNTNNNNDDNNNTNINNNNNNNNKININNSSINNTTNNNNDIRSIFNTKYEATWPKVNGHGQRPSNKTETNFVLNLIEKLDWQLN